MCVGGGWSRLSPTHCHITDCKLDSRVGFGGVCRCPIWCGIDWVYLTFWPNNSQAQIALETVCNQTGYQLVMTIVYMYLWSNKFTRHTYLCLCMLHGCQLYLMPHLCNRFCTSPSLSGWLSWSQSLGPGIAPILHNQLHTTEWSMGETAISTFTGMTHLSIVTFRWLLSLVTESEIWVWSALCPR